MKIKSNSAAKTDHSSARWQDVEQLIQRLIATHLILKDADFDAILAASMIAFGFVFIHPFEDGNGRIHRYLDDRFEMPDKTIALLVRFLKQNDGKMSKRAKEKELRTLSADEIIEIEYKYREIF